MSTQPSLVTALGDRRVVLCLGSGGVGKTTTSAALAVALAETGDRVVVLTIDPARRLADALGLRGELSNDPHLVTGGAGDGGAGAGGAGQVWAAMLDPAATFRTIVEAEADSAEQAERILANRLFRNLTSTLSGTSEYMAAERLNQLANDPRFDRVIVDTPPSHHALDFLDSPGRLTRFVDHRLYRSVLAPRQGLLRPLNTGARAIMRLLAGLVGSRLVDDVITFFAEFEGMDQGFRQRAAAIDSLLASDETAYVLVTAPRPDRLAEADWIVDNLERRGRSLHGVVVNRVLPIKSARASAKSGQSTAKSSSSDPLQANLDQLQALADQEAALIAPLADRAAPVVQVAEQLDPVKDLDGIIELAHAL